MTGEEKLKSVKIPHTEIVLSVYENKGTVSCGNTEFYDLPPFYRISLHSRPGKGSFIRSEVWLPDEWNGILVGIGNGGMGGNIIYTELAEYIKKGYAAVNTDLGTSRGVESGIDNPDVWKDFGFRATHIMTEAAKMLILEHYGKKQTYAYFVGCSTGGQQALSEAQRFPEDYDGIIAGVPANNRTMLHTYFLWNYVHLHPENKGPLFSEEKTEKINSCVVEYFQMLGDGKAGDNFITLPKADEKTVDDLIEFLHKKTDLTKTQLDALKAVYWGSINPLSQNRIYNGMPIGAEIFYCGINEYAREESPYFYPFIWAFGKNYNGYSFDFNKDMDALNEKLAPYLNANSADLSRFYSNGGKIIIYSGSADPCVPYPDAMNYYNRLADNMGGKIKDFVRYFLFPGMDHGRGGNGVNEIRSERDCDGTLSALRKWCEEGIAPNTLYGVSYKDKNKENGIRFIREIHCCSAEDREVCPPACSEYYLEK